MRIQKTIPKKDKDWVSVNLNHFGNDADPPLITTLFSFLLSTAQL